ncbi:STM3941 family protein [Tenacibaculum jejuense]|uniref:Uncharacterized protein n=1 Tax=Tenacibaculum jejuense TaxID=584609 RepID=A0A238UDF7_9FLAO|nr:STM3941 family protein [Tenacibaculum jejuense]SNR17209.1 conserved protein of unknown function [Tenacibaculum jejuense]
MMKEKIEIPLSKTKLFLSVLGAILFVIAGVWLFFNTQLFYNFPFKIFRIPIVIKIISVIDILFFGAIGLYALRKLKDKKPGLTIDAEGIFDNSNAASVGFIAWKDITYITVKKIMPTKIIIIDVVNPEEYLYKAKNKTTKKLLRSNMKMNGTPISISSNSLKIDFKELEKLLQTGLESSKNNTSL